jgi:hypothetical protein
VWLEVVGPIEHIETIAVGRSIRVLPTLRKRYGPGKWRKMKGIGKVRLQGGIIRLAELHWYEAHGIGRKRMKVKRYLE